MTVLKNLTLAPVKFRKVSQAEAEDAAFEMLRRAGLDGSADAYPHELSAGRQHALKA
jgi:polar amino acid transport system ATP-binding protein